MSIRGSLAVLVSALLALAPTLPGATPEAVGRVTANGVAQVNGIEVSSEATVFTGDRVNTAQNSVANLMLSVGNRVILPAKSSVLVRRNQSRDVVVLEHGALAVLTQSVSPAAIEVRGVSIRPAANEAAVIEVALEGNVLKVLSRRGEASLVASNKTLEVPSGKELDATLEPAGGGNSPGGRSGDNQGSGTVSAVSSWNWLTITALAAGLTGLGLGTAAVVRSNPSSCRAVSSTGKITCP